MVGVLDPLNDQLNLAQAGYSSEFQFFGIEILFYTS